MNHLTIQPSSLVAPPLRSASAPLVLSTAILFPSPTTLVKENSTPPLVKFDKVEDNEHCVLQSSLCVKHKINDTTAIELTCSNCNLAKPADAYSKNQTKKGPSKRKCNDCVTGKTPVSHEETNTETKDNAAPDIYFTQLSKERVRTTTFDATHTYFNQAKGDESSKRTNTKKIAKELKKLKLFLPLHRDAAIFVRFDKNKPFLMRALISGPPGTPYESGLFAFDMYCPPTYPEVPPKVLLLTTGKGTVRFSPNLYREGKVCLSLLGTWQGPGWDPKKSSLLQVLVSIQALVFVENPHSMEPGFGGWGEEASKMKSMVANCKTKDTQKNGRVNLKYMEQQCKNNDQTDNWGGSDPTGTIRSFILSAKDCLFNGTAASETKETEVDYEKFLNKHYLNIEGTRYNARIHAGTAAWAMHDMMSKPLVEFKDVIEKHFEIKKDDMNKQLHEWIKKDVALPHRQQKLIATSTAIQTHLKLDGIVVEEDQQTAAAAAAAAAAVVVSNIETNKLKTKKPSVIACDAYVSVSEIVF